MKRMRVEFLFASLLVVVFFPSSSSVCPSGRYGDACREYCGRCGARSTCDPYDGHCPQGCELGWRPPRCSLSFPVLSNPPTLRNRSGRSLTVAWKRWTRNSDLGEGNPAFYLLQIKMPVETEWVTLARIEANLWSERDDGFEARLHDVRQDVDYQVRIVILDESGGSQENALPILQLSRSTDATNETTETSGFDEIDDKRPRNRDSNNEWESDFIWIGVGVVVFCAFVVAVIIVITVECRRRRRRRNQQKTDSISLKNQEAGPGEENEAYSEVRPTGSFEDVTSDFDDDVFSDTRRDATRGRRYGQNVGWKEAIPGLNLSNAQVESWSTDWLDSRIYENQVNVK